MTATVDFVLRELQDALLVPATALRVRPPAELTGEAGNGGPQWTRDRGNGGANGATDANSAAASSGTGDPRGLAPSEERGNGGPSFGNANQSPSGNGERRSRPNGWRLPPGMGIVWAEEGAGKVRRVLVRQLGSDLTSAAIEPVKGELKEGDHVLLRAESAKPEGDQPRSLLAPPRPPRGTGGGPRT
jgi:hypothetical protein